MEQMKLFQVLSDLLEANISRGFVEENLSSF